MAPSLPLRLFPSEAAARKAGQALASLDGERLATVLYILHPADAPKPVFLLSASYRLTVAEQRWVSEQQATTRKLGRFMLGGAFMPLQTNMVRRTGPAT
jgi:hypothetical protein